nr:hypothetical protein [Neobacillus kokaensis]
MLYIWIMTVLFIGVGLLIFCKKIYFQTSTMAAVMAFGIFTEGVLLNHFGTRFFHSNVGKILSICNLSFWFACISSFFIALFHGKFKKLHYTNQINRFGIGTWVASTSICGIIMYNQFTEWRMVSEIISFLNIILWSIYIGFCLKTIIEIRRSKLYGKVHGIILLTTVSTQSIVLLMNTVFKDLPVGVSLPFLLIGLSFYGISAFLLFYRYGTTSWSIEADWNNTNCIVHGALSISGIACLVSGIVPFGMIRLIWWLAAIMFLAVESMEIYRIIRRIQLFGVKKGLFVYNVTQWSRIFTFAMFYTFTSFFHPQFLIIQNVKNAVLTEGVWIIILLLTIELILSAGYILKLFKKSSIDLSSDQNIGKVSGTM